MFNIHVGYRELALSVHPITALCIVEFQNIIEHFLDSLAAHARMRIRFHYLYELVCFIFRMRVNIYRILKCQAFHTHYSFNLRNNPAR